MPGSCGFSFVLGFLGLLEGGFRVSGARFGSRRGGRALVSGFAAVCVSFFFGLLLMAEGSRHSLQGVGLDARHRVGKG